METKTSIPKKGLKKTIKTANIAPPFEKLVTKKQKEREKSTKAYQKKLL